MGISKWQNLFRCKIFRRKYSISHLDSEYTSTPRYPPILDLSFEKKKEREKEAVHEEIANVKTVEEKQIKLNMPKYYGFETHMFLEESIPYNNLQLAQYVTKTHLIEQKELPKFYENIGVNSTAINELKKELEEAVLFELDGYRHTHDLRKEHLRPFELDNFIGSCLVKQINRILINKLCKFYNHLTDIQLDLDPRIESSWCVGGIDPPERVKSSRRGVDWLKHMENEPVDRYMNYIGKPYLSLRSKQPLPAIMSLEEASNKDLQVPFWKYDPRVVGICTKTRRLVNIPGFWPGDEYRFGILQYLKRGHHIIRKFDDQKDAKDALHRQGILASFAWSHAQANHLGFTTFNDITYPLTTQTIITNGQVFSFYVYQLNTTLFHSKNICENPKKNICWASPEMKLFEKNDGKIENFNEEVLERLVKFYANTPSERLGVNLTPYLSQNEKFAADYDDQEKREWLEREYKFIMSNRPRHHHQEEIFAWEKIYKIDHKTRPLDKRRKFFELRQNPSKRTFDDRKPRYIPRALRPDLPRHKGRDAKEFFP